MSELTDGAQIEFVYAPGTSLDQIIGFEMAGEIWSSHLNDDVTVRIYVESSSELPDEVVGAALPGKKAKIKYDKLWEGMSDDITSSNDRLAFDNLPSDEKEISVTINGQELDETKEFRLTNANAKSLGLLKDDRKRLDGYIIVNDLTGSSGVGWDYDALRSGNIEGDKIDFLSVAMHETGHVLGFVSGVDDEAWLKVLTEAQEKEKEIKGKDFKFASTMDLYRYADSDESEGNIDLSIGGNPYFSLDGGNSNLGYFANGQNTDYGGDGYQASHWKQDSSQGIMNPILPTGGRKDITNLDLTAMDVIGWDLNTGDFPSWEEMYDNAVADAETAIIEDREKDVEKLVKESDYEGRRRLRSNSSSWYWQTGYWQYTTLQGVNTSEVIVEEDSQTNADYSSDDIDDSEDSEENEDSSNTESDLDTDSDESVFIDLEDGEEDTEDDDSYSESDLGDDSAITGISDGGDEDPLLSGSI